MSQNTPYNQDFFNNIATEFDNHVQQSIPLFFQFQSYISGTDHKCFQVSKDGALFLLCRQEYMDTRKETLTYNTTIYHVGVKNLINS